MRSLDARLAYLQMDALLIERDIDRARDGISRYQIILSEQEALLDGVRAAIVNLEDAMESRTAASSRK